MIYRFEEYVSDDVDQSGLFNPLSKIAASTEGPEQKAKYILSLPKWLPLLRTNEDKIDGFDSICEMAEDIIAPGSPRQVFEALAEQLFSLPMDEEKYRGVNRLLRMINGINESETKAIVLHTVMSAYRQIN